MLSWHIRLHILKRATHAELALQSAHLLPVTHAELANQTSHFKLATHTEVAHQIPPTHTGYAYFAGT
jgi:hypothetical protein